MAWLVPTRSSSQNHVSRCRNIHAGVPQGPVIAPLLFNFYVADAPIPLPPIFLESYADDFNPYATAQNWQEVVPGLSTYIDSLG